MNSRKQYEIAGEIKLIVKKNWLYLKEGQPVPTAPCIISYKACQVENRKLLDMLVSG